VQHKIHRHLSRDSKYTLLLPHKVSALHSPFRSKAHYWAFYPFPRPSQASLSSGSTSHCCSVQTICWHPLHMFLPFLTALPNSVDHTAFLKLLSNCFFLLLQGNGLGDLVSASSLRHSTTLPGVQHSPPYSIRKSKVRTRKYRNILKIIVLLPLTD
jgi:hypothetical protein